MNSHSSERKAQISNEPIQQVLSDEEAKPLNIHRNNQSNKNGFAVDYFNPSVQVAQKPKPQDIKQGSTSQIINLEKNSPQNDLGQDQYTFDMNDQMFSSKKVEKPDKLQFSKKIKQRKHIANKSMNFIEQAKLEKSQNIQNFKFETDSRQETSQKASQKLVLSQRQSLKLKSRAQMLINQAQLPPQRNNDFRDAIGDMSSFTNNSSKSIFKPVLSQNIQPDGYGFRQNQLNIRRFQAGSRALRSAQGQRRPQTMQNSQNQSHYVAMTNNFGTQPLVSQMSNNQNLVENGTAITTPQYALDQQIPLNFNPSQPISKSGSEVSRSPTNLLPGRRIRSGIQRRQQQYSMSSVGGDGNDSLVLGGIRNINNITDMNPTADDVSSLFGGQQHIRKSVSRRRLKSANIYSQKIKMYNPNMLIFTPNQMFQQQQQQVQTFSGIQQALHEMNQHVQRKSIDENIPNSSIGQQIEPEQSRKNDTQSMQSNLDFNNLKDRLKRRQSDIERKVKLMQNTSGFDGIQLSPESLYRIGQRGINNGVFLEKSKQRGKLNQQSNGVKVQLNEEIKDQLQLLKSEMHIIKDQNLKLKTKNKLQEQKLKTKEKQIEDLIKQSYIFSAGIANSHLLKPATTSKVNTGISSEPGSPKFQSPAKGFDDEQRKLFRKHFIEQGPFDLLKMRRQLNDFEDLVQQKNQEIEELKHNIKSTKLTEAQDEVLIYQKECMKLRYISEISLCLLVENGLFNLIKNNKKLNGFLKTINWEYMGMKNAISNAHSNIQYKSKKKEDNTLNQQTENLINNNQTTEQRGSSFNDHINNNNTGQVLKQIDQNFDEVMNQLNKENMKLKNRINNLQMNLKKQQELAKKAQSENQKIQIEMKQMSSLVDQRKDTIDELMQKVAELTFLNGANKDSNNEQNEVKNITSSRNLEEISNLKNEINDLKKKLDDEKQLTFKANCQVDEIKQKLDRANRIKKSPVKFEESNQDINEKDKRIKELETTNKDLIKELDQSQSQQIQRNKDLLDLQIKMQDLQRESNKKQQEIDRLTLLIATQANQITTRDSGQPQDKNTSENKFSSTKNVLDNVNLHEVQSASAKSNMGNRKAAPTIQIPSQQEKFNKQSYFNNNNNNHNLSQSSQVIQDLQNIEDQLNHIDFDNLDERSDIVSRVGSVKHKLLSQKSFFDNKSNYAKSPTRFKRMATHFEKYSETPQPQIIEEDVEKEEQLETVNLQKQIEKEQKREREASRENEKKKRGFLRHAGKAQSNVDSESLYGAQRNILDRQCTKYKLYHNMNQQIDQINDKDSICTEIISNIEGISAFEPYVLSQQKVPMRSTFYVKREEPKIEMVFDRLKTLLQIKRISIDQILSEMFNFEKTKNGEKMFGNLKLCEISPLFMNRLDIQLQDATRFARFLVEEKDDQAEEDPDNAKIQYDPNRKVNLQMLDVRLKLFAPHCKLFSYEQEQQMREDFTKAFSGKHIKFIRIVEQKAKSQENKIINLEDFKQLVYQMVNKNQLSGETIECAYIYLCRPCEFNDVKNLSNQEIAKAVQGFDSQKTFKIFTQHDDDSSSTKGDNYRDSGRHDSGISGSMVTGSQPRLNFGKSDKLKDSDTHERASADSQNAVTPVLGAMNQRRDTLGFTGMTNNFKNDQGRRPSNDYLAQKIQMINSRHNSQDKDSKDKSSKDKQNTDEMEENCGDEVAPLPTPQQFLRFQRSLKKSNLSYNCKCEDDAQGDQSNFSNLGQNFADQVIQYDKQSQQNSAVNEVPQRQRISPPYMRLQTQQFHQTGKMSTNSLKEDIMPDKIHINENKPSESDMLDQELMVKKQHTKIQIQNLDTQLMDDQNGNNIQSSYPYNDNLAITRNISAMYSDERSESDFDMQESMCRKSSYVRGMQYKKQETQQSQITSGQLKNIYNKQDKDIIIRQQAILYQQSSKDNGSFNFSQSHDALNLIKQKSISQQEEVNLKQSKDKEMNKTQKKMDNTMTAQSKMQGITDGTSTTLEKKAFGETIQEEIKKNQSKDLNKPDINKIMTFSNQNVEQPEKKVNAVKSLLFNKQNEILDKLQSKVANVYQVYQRAITFNRNCQEMLNKSDEDGEDSLEEQYQQDLEDSLAQQKLHEQLDNFVFDKDQNEKKPTLGKPLNVNEIFKLKPNHNASPNLEIPDPTSHRQISSAAGAGSKQSSEFELQRQTNINPSQFDQTHLTPVKDAETPTTIQNNVFKSQNLLIETNQTSMGANHTGPKNQEDSLSPADIRGSHGSKVNASDPKLSISPLSRNDQEQPVKELKSSEQVFIDPNSLRDPYVQNLNASGMMQSSQGTPAFDQRDLKSYIPEDNESPMFKKFRSEREKGKPRISHSIESYKDTEQMMNSTNPKQLSQVHPTVGTGSANSSSRQIKDSSAIEPIVEEEQVEEKSFEGTTKRLDEKNNSENVNKDAIVQSPEKVQIPQITMSKKLEELIKKKLDIAMQNQVSMKAFQMIIDVTEKILNRMAKLLRGLESNPQKFTVRGLFKDKIYLIKDTRKNNDEQESADLPVVQMKDVVDRFNFLIQDYKNNKHLYQQPNKQTSEEQEDEDLGDPITQNELQCFESVFQDPKLANMIPLDDLISTFEILNIQKFKPISEENISSEQSDQKQI